jgi:hypothetical protein
MRIENRFFQRLRPSIGLLQEIQLRGIHSGFRFDFGYENGRRRNRIENPFGQTEVRPVGSRGGHPTIGPPEYRRGRVPHSGDERNRPNVRNRLKKRNHPNGEPENTFFPFERFRHRRDCGRTGSEGHAREIRGRRFRRNRRQNARGKGSGPKNGNIERRSVESESPRTRHVGLLMGKNRKRIGSGGIISDGFETDSNGFELTFERFSIESATRSHAPTN